jgi:hypothetical protein
MGELNHVQERVGRPSLAFSRPTAAMRSESNTTARGTGTGSVICSSSILIETKF